MEKGYLPLEHHYRLVKDHAPAMRWDGEENFNEWKTRAKEKLSELLGLAEIEKFACPVEIEVEFDRFAEDLNAREIRFRFKSEENVTGMLMRKIRLNAYLPPSFCLLCGCLLYKASIKNKVNNSDKVTAKSKKVTAVAISSLKR